MAHLIVTGIVTRYVNYKDNDRILTIFSPQQGRIDAKARGCRRPKSPLLACAQPFVYGEFQLFTGKGHFSIDQCDVRETFYPLREEVYKLASASAMLTLAQQAIQEDEANPALFSLLYHGLSFLCYGEIEPLDGALCFITRYLKTIGICPAITQCAACGKDIKKTRTFCFSPASGGAVCDDCMQGGSRISALSGEAMRRMLLLEDAGMGRVKLPGQVRRELFPALEQYCAYYLEQQNKPLETLRGLLR